MWVKEGFLGKFKKRLRKRENCDGDVRKTEYYKS